MTIEAKGYAVVENGEINVRSVCPTRIGAMVNFLLTSRNTVVFRDTPDEAVEAKFAKVRGDAEVCAIMLVKEENKDGG